MMKFFLKTPKRVSDGIDPAFFNQVSQFAHFFTSAFLVFSAGVFFGWGVMTAVFVLCVSYAAWHEFWYDPRYENAATRGSDLEDFAFLVSGDLIGVAMWRLAEWVGRLPY
jgi:hypothetical protein